MSINLISYFCGIASLPLSFSLRRTSVQSEKLGRGPWMSLAPAHLSHWRGSATHRNGGRVEVTLHLLDGHLTAN